MQMIVSGNLLRNKVVESLLKQGALYEKKYFIFSDYFFGDKN